MVASQSFFPYGKFFNPLELINGFIKNKVRRMYVVSDAAQSQRARTFKALEYDRRKAAEEVTPKLCHPFLEKEPIEGI